MKFAAILCAVSAVALLTACDSQTASLHERVNGVTDMGRMPLPNSKFQLHGYRLNNGINKDHFVYILEDSANQPVAGTLSNQEVSSGKTTANIAVNSFVAPSATTQQLTLDIKLACSSTQDCNEKLKRLEGM